MISTNSKLERFQRVAAELRASSALSRPGHLSRIHSMARGLLSTLEGTRGVYELIGALEAGGLFDGGPWEELDRLAPSLVGGTLKAGGPTTQMEVLSDLRVLAYAEGELSRPSFSRDQARDFLEKVLALNLDLAFGAQTEELRALPERERDQIRSLFALLVERLPLAGVKDALLEEVELICHQRPILTSRVRSMLETIRGSIELEADRPADQRLARYIEAVSGPTEAAAAHPDPERYREALRAMSPEERLAECRAMGGSIGETGLVSEPQAALVAEVAGEVEPLAAALGLNAVGRAELARHHRFVVKLVRAAVVPSTAQAIYGLGRLLERGLLRQPPVRNSLGHLKTLKLHPAVESEIRRTVAAAPDLPATVLLLADTIRVLGQPLGVGQGASPTCQAARAISLWSQHAPGRLLELIITAAASNNLSMRFEGVVLDSKGLPPGLARDIDVSLDAVSVVLVPHLDRIYNEMMRRAAVRGEDPHKWVNPALYGHWIPTGFASAYNPVTNTIHGYDQFAGTFFAAYHPDFNGGLDLIAPCPLGLMITSASAKLLGFHAVLMLRVARAASGEVRAYFLNPNEEGRQDWGQGIRPSVSGQGERHGESSLPFGQLLSRVYAFHYNPNVLAPLSAVDPALVSEVRRLARESWGREYTWFPDP